MTSVSFSDNKSSESVLMPTYIRYLGKIPFKVIPITDVLLISGSLLNGWEITAFKLAAIGFGSGFAFHAIGSAKGLINFPKKSKNPEKPTITLYDKQNFSSEIFISGTVIATIAGISSFLFASIII